MFGQIDFFGNILNCDLGAHASLSPLHLHHCHGIIRHSDIIELKTVVFHKSIPHGVLTLAFIQCSECDVHI